MKNLPGKIIIVGLLVAVSLLSDRPLPGKALVGEQINQPEVWADPDRNNFVVATYNIRRSKGNDGIRDISRSAGVLERAGADVVGLNELSGTLFYGFENQARQLGTLLGTGWLFAPVEDRWYQNYFGNGLLSKFPVNHWEIHPLFAEWGEEESRSLRNMIIATIPIADKDVNFLITHLDRGAINERQLQYVIRTFQQLSAPAVLLGDLNVSIDNVQIMALLDTSGYDDAIRLATGDRKPHIDWIISKGLIVKSGGIEPGGVSDHAGYWVEFELP